jgi:yecA family protein
MPERLFCGAGLDVSTSSEYASLDYERLRSALTSAGAVVSLAELHGGVCASLCAGGAPAAERWLADSFDDHDLRSASSSVVESELNELVGSSWKMLAADELEFEPLLPSADAPLDERVQALAQWCQGFLAALGATAPAIARESDADAGVGEILQDLAEISRAGLSEEEAAAEEEADFSLAKIHEHVRVSVQIIFEQLAPQRAAAVRDVH